MARSVIKSVKPLINLNSTCHSEILNTLVGFDYPVYFSENEFYDEVKKCLHESAQVFDFSDIALPAYLSNMKDSRICSFSVSNPDAVKKYTDSGLKQPLTVNLTLASNPAGFGCTFEKLESVFAAAQSHSQSVRVSTY